MFFLLPCSIRKWKYGDGEQNRVRDKGWFWLYYPGNMKKSHFRNVCVCVCVCVCAVSYTHLLFTASQGYSETSPPYTLCSEKVKHRVNLFHLLRIFTFGTMALWLLLCLFGDRVISTLQPLVKQHLRSKVTERPSRLIAPMRLSMTTTLWNNTRTLRLELVRPASRLTLSLSPLAYRIINILRRNHQRLSFYIEPYS